MYIEREISDEVLLCDESGRLNQASVGWSRKPLHRCNLRGNWPRKKQWNYWYVMNDDCFFSATIAMLDYAAIIFIYYLDVNSLEFEEKTIISPLGQGTDMSETVGETVRFSNDKNQVIFSKEDNYTRLIVEVDDFKGKNLRANIKVFQPDNIDSINVVIPWSDRKFQFTSKQSSLPAQGKVTIGEKVYEFSPDNSFACLDFGRGIWPYKSEWNWASGTGLNNGVKIGLNFGAGWTEDTGITENGIIVDGRAEKINEDIRFNYNPADLMETWSLTTIETDRISLKFEPIYHRVAKTNFFVIKSKMHQMIGYYSGKIKFQDQIINIDKLPGTTEEHQVRW